MHFWIRNVYVIQGVVAIGWCTLITQLLLMLTHDTWNHKDIISIR